MEALYAALFTGLWSMFSVGVCQLYSYTNRSDDIPRYLYLLWPIWLGLAAFGLLEKKGE